MTLGAVKSGGRGMVYAGKPVISGALAFMFLIARMAGLAPLRFERKTSQGRPTRWILHPSTWWNVYSYGLLLTLVLVTLMGLINDLYGGTQLSVRMQSLTSQVVGSGDVLTVVCACTAGVLGAPERARRTCTLLRLLDTVDTSLGVEYNHSQERKHCLIIVFLLFLWACLLCDDLNVFLQQAIEINVYSRQLQNFTAFYMLYCVVVLLEIQLAYTSYAICLRFRDMNNALQNTARTIKTSIAKNGNKSSYQEPVESIRRLSELHVTLLTAIQEVDISYGVPILIILITSLLHLVVTPYFLIQGFGSGEDTHYIFLQSGWCLAHSLRLVLIVEPCHLIQMEATRTGVIVGDMLGQEAAGDGVLRRLELFSRQLLTQNASITAMGVCALDRPVLARVTAAVTTYLVILMQFRRQDDTK